MLMAGDSSSYGRGYVLSSAAPSGDLLDLGGAQGLASIDAQGNAPDQSGECVDRGCSLGRHHVPCGHEDAERCPDPRIPLGMTGAGGFWGAGTRGGVC